MNDLELIFSMLGEASTTAITRSKDAQTFDANKQAAKEGGKVAGDARKQLEQQTGKPVVTKKTTYLKRRKPKRCAMKTKTASIKKTAVLYARVSTRDQEEIGHSLPAQIAKLEEYADRNGFEIIKVFSFQETGGQKQQRRKFMEMLNYLRQFDAETMPALLCNNVDRITRNFKDHVEIDEMRQQNGLHVHFVQDGFIITPQSSGNDLFQWDAKAFLAKQYLHRVRDDAIRSHEYKIKKGEWPHKAPIGYLNTRNDEGRSVIVLDPERAPLVRRLFVEYAKGTYSVQEMARMVTLWGLRNKTNRAGKLSASQVHQTLTNPFYYGVMLQQGQTYNHVHPRLIDKAVWDKCQQVRDSYKKVPFAYAAKPFTFRGLITCGHCGSVYTTEQKKGKYNYLFCTKNKDKNCPAPRMKEEAVFAQVAEVLDSVAMPESVLMEVRKHLAESHDAKNEFHNIALKGLKQQLTQLDRKQQKLWDLYLRATEETDSSITPDELDKMLKGIKQEKKEIEDELKSHDGADDDYYISLNLLLELVQNAGKLFHSASIEQKRKILKLVYWNLELTDGKLVYALRKPFDLFLDTTKTEKWLGYLDSNQGSRYQKPMPYRLAIPQHRRCDG